MRLSLLPTYLLRPSDHLLFNKFCRLIQVHELYHAGCIRTQQTVCFKPRPHL